VIFGRRRGQHSAPHRATHRAATAAPAPAVPTTTNPGGGAAAPADATPAGTATAAGTGPVSVTGAVTGTGRVLTREGWPVPGASVTLLGADGSQLGRGLSATDGGLRLAGLRPGPATLLIAAPGHDPRVHPVVVPGGPVWSIGDLRVERQGAGDKPPPGVWVLDIAHSTVSATAHHLGLAAVHGRFGSFTGVITVPEHDVTASTVEVSIDAASIDTGNAQRDAHLRSSDFLDTANHPTLHFVSTGLTRSADGRGWTLDGQLTMAGTTRPVQLALTYNGSGPDPWGGTRAAFSASTELHREDFRMNWNQAVGVGVSLFGTTLKISIDVEAVLQT
jgi:polyisoprenoid-binding protein YceI